MDLKTYKSFHFVGIGGMGMRALAKILLEKGYTVSGSDMSDSAFLEDFRKKGAQVYIGHEAAHVKDCDCIVISSAISKDNPELVEAENRGIPVFHRSDVLAAIFGWGRGIAVAGAHGKSTTSAMVGQIFYEAKKDPTIVLGAAADYIHGNSVLGHGDYVIAEADESDGSFLKFSTYMTVVTNIEDDHLDHYGTVENIRKAFVEFISHISYDDGMAILCIDSDGVRQILPEIKKKVITYGLSAEAEYQAVNKRYVNKHLLFDVAHRGQTLGTIELQIPGTHNVRDALGAVVAALSCGIPMETIEEALRHFVGVKRRFETKSRDDGLWVVDDYAHHPTEIKATLSAARETGDHRIICAFQPHRYSRTKLLQDEFAEAFDAADVLFFTDIYAASEEKIPGIDGHLIPSLVQKRLPEKEIHYVDQVTDMAAALRDFVKPGDMIITMGAGSIFRSGEELIQLIKEKGFAN